MGKGRRRRGGRREEQGAALPVPAETSAPALQGEIFPEAIEVRRSQFSGPIPPPDVLLEYNQVLPGLADRIVQMAEDEGRQRRALAARVVRLSELGLASATLISLAIVVGGLIAAALGAPLAGFAAVLVAVTGLVTVFVVGRRVGPPRELRGGGAAEFSTRPAEAPSSARPQPASSEVLALRALARG